MASPSELLRRHGLRPKKAWGQNFLGDDRHLAAIARAAGAGPGGGGVGLGAGLGHLTRHLHATGAKVVAVERISEPESDDNGDGDDAPEADATA